MTNRDKFNQKLLSLTDEELASIVEGNIDTCGICPAYEFCVESENLTGCKKVLLEWFKQESDNEEATKEHDIQEKFTPGPWEVFDWISSITVREGKKMVCRCTKNEHGKVYAAMIAAAPEMYDALKDVCGDCEKLSNWEDLFNIGRPEGTVMPPCPCKECNVGRILKKARGEC